MSDALVGTWNYESADNLDAYMDAMGVSDQIKEFARNSKPVLDIVKEGTVWNIKTTVGDKVSEAKYPENEEIETMNLMGKPMKATLSVSGDGLIEKQKIGDLDIVIERKVVDGVYVSNMTTGGVTATLKFTRA